MHQVGRLTPEDLARYPIITIHDGFTGRPSFDRAFEASGLNPGIVMAALEADVINAYVELGMGVGTVAAMALDPDRDTALASLDGAHLFSESTSPCAVASSCAGMAIG